MCALWKKKPAGPAPRGRADAVSEILGEAVSQRVRACLTFLDDVTNIKDLVVSFEEADAGGVVVRIPSLCGMPENWIGAPVVCHFRISDAQREKRMLFFKFSTSVIAVEPTTDGEVRIGLAAPEALENAQQRRCVRVAVDSARVPLFSLWLGLPEGTRIAGNSPRIVSGNAASACVRMGNLSTTGLRLIVRTDAEGALASELQDAQGCAFYFEAKREDADTTEAFFANAKLRNVQCEAGREEALLGFEFLAEGAIDDDGCIKWEPLKSGEITGLGPFVFKWNLTDFCKGRAMQ